MWERRPGQRRPLILLFGIATVVLALCYVALAASTTPSNNANHGALVMLQDSTPVSQGAAVQPSTITPIPTPVPPIKHPTPCTHSCASSDSGKVLDTFSLVAGLPALLSFLLLLFAIVWQRRSGRAVGRGTFSSALDGRHGHENGVSSSSVKNGRNTNNVSRPKR